MMAKESSMTIAKRLMTENSLALNELLDALLRDELAVDFSNGKIKFADDVKEIFFGQSRKTLVMFTECCLILN